MELTQIRYFVAVAQCENMSRAATQLHITQPSLSKSIAKLEDELGCKLLDRNGRHITLNEEGQRFLKGALAMLRELDDATFDLQEMMQSPVARLTIGLVGSDSLLTGCLMSFAKEHPEVRFHIQCDIEAVEQLDINQYDMLLYPKGEHYRKFTGIPVGTEGFLLAVPQSHPLARCSVVHVTDLDREDFVFIKHGRDHVELAYELCVGRGFYPKVRSFTNSLDMHRQVIATGSAVGFVAEGCADAYVQDRRIRLVPVEDKGFALDMMVCFRRDKHLSATGAALKEHVLRYYVSETGVRRRGVRWK